MGRAEGRGHDEVGPRVPAARRGPPRPPLRRVRRLPRRLGHRRRALHGRRRARASAGSAPACWAGAPTTGAASRCASGRGTSRPGAATGWATTGRSPTTTSSRTTTSWTSWWASSAATRDCPTTPTASSSPRPTPRCHELLTKKACDALGVRCIPSRLSILTRPHNGRPACHYCGQCGRGCATHSNFSVPSVFLPPALATGKLKIVTGAMVREVNTSREGLATGVSYVDVATGREMSVRAKVVVLAASACESARLLLNSKSPRHPNGLANGSGAVGRYLTDTPGTTHPRLHSRPRRPARPQRGRHRRPASLHAVVARQPEARLPPRVSLRVRRRPRHAGLRVHGRHPSRQRRRLRPEAEGGLPPLLRLVPELRRRAAR